MNARIYNVAVATACATIAIPNPIVQNVMKPRAMAVFPARVARVVRLRALFV